MAVAAADSHKEDTEDVEEKEEINLKQTIVAFKRCTNRHNVYQQQITGFETNALTQLCSIAYQRACIHTCVRTRLHAHSHAQYGELLVS